MNKTELKKGQKTSVVVYSGTSKIEADLVSEYMKAHIYGRPAAPLEGSDLRLSILDIELTTIPDDDLTKDTIYEIRMKGELI